MFLWHQQANEKRPDISDQRTGGSMQARRLGEKIQGKAEEKTQQGKSALGVLNGSQRINRKYR